MSVLPGSATKQARISRPVSVRIGMFCRFGSTELRRPVAVLVPDRLEHARVGGEAGLAAALAAQAELDEQDVRELLRGADHELLARELPDLALELGGVRADPAAELLQQPGVDLHPRLLALAQHVH